MDAVITTEKHVILKHGCCDCNGKKLNPETWML
jgi:hypothetical protein